MLTISKSITGVCWHLKLNNVVLETRCKKYEIEEQLKIYKRKLGGLYA